MRPLINVLLLSSALLLAGCGGTVTPNVVTSPSASVGPNGQHSDIHAFYYAANGTTITGESWYETKRQVYNKLIAKFGKDPTFLVALTPDAHLTRTGLYWKADQVAISNDVQLLRLYYASLKP